MLGREEFAKLMVKNGMAKSQREAKENLDKFIGLLEEAILENGGLQLIGWGKLEIVKTAPKIGRNPKTGEEVKIPEGKKIKFTAGKELKEKLK